MADSDAAPHFRKPSLRASHETQHGDSARGRATGGSLRLCQLAARDNSTLGAGDLPRSRAVAGTAAGRADPIAPCRLASLKRASLIGHSIAGAELTRFAARFPDRTDKLVYLDASHDFAGIDSVLGANPAWPPAFSPPRGTARDTLNAGRDRMKRYRFGYWSDALESGILRSPASDDASDECLLRDATLHPKEYGAVRGPALALTARYTMENWFFYLDPVADSAKWRGAEHWLTKVVQPWLAAGHERFRREMRNGRTIEIEADHHLFNSHPSRVLREIRGFLLSSVAP